MIRVLFIDFPPLGDVEDLRSSGYLCTEGRTLWNGGTQDLALDRRTPHPARAGLRVTNRRVRERPAMPSFP